MVGVQCDGQGGTLGKACEHNKISLCGQPLGTVVLLLDSCINLETSQNFRACRKEVGLTEVWSSQAHGQLIALGHTLLSCVTLGKSLYCSSIWFPFFQNVGNI